MLKHWTLIAVSAIALAGCDVVRVPGGDHQNEPRPVIPDGAPGPAPPTVPVTDPYGEGEEPVQIPVNNPDPVDETTGSRDDETSEETPPTDPAPDDVAPVEDEVPADPTDPVVVDPDPVIDDPDSAPIDAVDPGTDAPVEEPDGTDLVEAPSEPDPEPLPVKFEFFAPGDLLPGSGFGRADDTVYAPAMVFPIKSAPTYLNSQVYRPGGGVGGDQCDVSNYSMPWRIDRIIGPPEARSGQQISW
ncbi:MAG: hypothetical protein AAGL09_04075, partial [Pseudomonadota bacterium]